MNTEYRVANDRLKRRLSRGTVLWGGGFLGFALLAGCDDDKRPKETVGLTVTSVAITPATSPTNDAVLTCNAMAVGADGAEVAVAYAWTNVAQNHAALGTEAVLTLTPTVASPGDEIICEATATDGTLTASDFASVTVSNRAPVIADAAITPSSGVTNTSLLTCSATASDVDGATPTVSYAWTNVTQGNVALGTGQTLTLTPSAASPGDEVACVATANDGTLTATDNASVAVALSPGCSALNQRSDHLTYEQQSAFITDTFAVGETVVVYFTPDSAPANTFVQAWWDAEPDYAEIIGDSGGNAGSSSAVAAPVGVTALFVRLMGQFSGSINWTITYACAAPQ